MSRWKNLPGQILAGTRKDSQGETNTKEFLEKLCKIFSSREKVPLTQRHDMSLDPVGYINNFKVVESKEKINEWYLVGDVHFQDVNIDEALKGFSYSITEDIKENGSSKELGIYLPFPKYNDTQLSDDLLGAGENIVVGAWKRKAADPATVSLIISFCLFAAAPAYTNYWNNKISPVLKKLLSKLSGDESIQFVQTSEGHKGETFGIYFFPIKGHEHGCLTLDKVLKGMGLADEHVLNDDLAKDKGVHLIKLMYSENTQMYKLSHVEYQDGSVIKH